MGLTPFRRAGPLEEISDSPERSVQRRSWSSRMAFFGFLAVFFLLAVACSQGKQSTWDAVGPVAEKQLQLFQRPSSG